jgi:hypothetical protein
MKPRRTHQGSASVEVVVMLPVFVVLFTGIHHVHGVAMARLEARAAARGCAYQFAMAACRDLSPAVDLCASAEPLRGAPLDGASGEDASNSVLESIEDWPLLGPMVTSVFGESASARAEREAHAYLGDDPTVAVGDLHLVCNTEPRAWNGIASHVCELARLALGEELPGC